MKVDCFLMHKNIPVLKLVMEDRIGIIIETKEILNVDHFPYCIQVTNNDFSFSKLSNWWSNRSIPNSRPLLREVLRFCKLYSTDQLIYRSNGISLSDQYWICPTNSPLKWEEVNFFNNNFPYEFGYLMLGLYDIETTTKNFDLKTPNNTCDGVLPKTWKTLDNRKLLIKGGKKCFFYQEPLNEVIASMIMDKLSIPHVKYQLKYVKVDGMIIPFSYCECFITPETELVTEDQFMMNSKIPDQMSHYQYYIDCCKNVGIMNAQLRVDQMIVVDFLIANSDRHTNNFGLIRNADNLKFVDIAPIYDNGNSLWYDSQDDWIVKAKDISKPFANRHYKQIKFVSNFDWLELNKLEGFENEMKKIFDESPYISQKRQEIICENFKKRIRLLQKYINERKKNPDYDPELDVEFNPGKEGISQFEDDPENIVDTIHFS